MTSDPCVDRAFRHIDLYVISSRPLGPLMILGPLMKEKDTNGFTQEHIPWYFTHKAAVCHNSFTHLLFIILYIRDPRENRIKKSDSADCSATHGVESGELTLSLTLLEEEVPYGCARHN